MLRLVLYAICRARSSGSVVELTISTKTLTNRTCLDVQLGCCAFVISDNFMHGLKDVVDLIDVWLIWCTLIAPWTKQTWAAATRK